MIENVIPYGNRVLVRKLDNKTDRVGNIIIPDATGDKPFYAEVVAVGKGAYNFNFHQFIPMSTKVGDIVVLPKAGPAAVKIDGKEYLTIEEHYLLLNIVK